MYARFVNEFEKGMEYNYTTTGSTALRASMQIFTDETYTEAYLGLFETSFFGLIVNRIQQ